MSTEPQFDLFRARDLRDQGLRQVASNNEEFLEAARTTAREICKLKGTVTADEVREGCRLLPAHPNAWGAVFKGKDFTWTGQYQQSTIVSRHGGMQRVWRLT